MTTPFWCLFIALLLPYVLTSVAGYFKVQQFGSVDNKHPRLQSRSLEGAGARAVAAQENLWEAIAVFTAAVLVNHQISDDPRTSGLLAIAWLVFRVLHAGFYIADVDKGRSAAFLGALACAVALFFV